MNGLQALVITLILVIIVFTPIILLIRYQLKKGEKNRKIEIRKSSFKKSSFFIDDFYEKDLNKQITLRNYIFIFGEKKVWNTLRMVLN